MVSGCEGGGGGEQIVPPSTMLVLFLMPPSCMVDANEVVSTMGAAMPQLRDCRPGSVGADANDDNLNNHAL